jgi:thioredoxin-related protein
MTGAMLAVALASLAGSEARPPRGTMQLVMFDAPGCIYCRRWDAEVGAVYDRTAEGRRAPLLRRNIGDRDVSFIRGVRYTPTFVLLEGEREVGRIVGYGGQDHFWGQLEGLLARIGSGREPPPGPIAPGARAL